MKKLKDRRTSSHSMLKCTWKEGLKIHDWLKRAQSEGLPESEDSFDFFSLYVLFYLNKSHNVSIP